MKKPLKMLWICLALMMALGVLLVGGVVSNGKTLSYPELKASCDDVLSKSPQSAALDTWLDANRISSHRVAEPLDESFRRILVSNGISSANANKAASCIYFESLRVRGGFLSTHVAYGYFVFTADGSLLDYNIHDIYYGM
jgi:hypothetical protein